MNSFSLLILFFAMTLVSGGLTQASTAKVNAVPVQYGQYEEADACTSQGRIAGAKSGMVSVKSAPNSDAPEIDRISNGQWVAMCDDREHSGENWSGVVYVSKKDASAGKNLSYCGVTSPIKKQKPYNGPCKSGWIRSKWLTDIAG